MKPFVVNRYGRLVFPSNLYPEPDFASLESVDALKAVIRRDFEVKAPNGTTIAKRADDGAYANRYELLRDLALHLYWMNRYAIAMYHKRPTRWRDVPKTRRDVFLPVLTPWKGSTRKVEAVERGYDALPAAWDADVEDELFAMLFDLFRHKQHHASDLAPIKPTVAEAIKDPANRVYHLVSYDPDYPRFGLDEVLHCAEAVPELEALRRWAMVLHNRYPWNRAQARLTRVGDLANDDVVVVYHPRTREVADFIRRVSTERQRRHAPAPAPPREPFKPLPAVQVPRQFAIQPRLESLAVRRGELTCTNDDIIRNAASSWSPMSAAEITAKTGIESRCYTEGGLEDLAFPAAVDALEKAERSVDEIGAVVFCTCTNQRLIPSAATWLSGQLGMLQTHTSVDLVAACAGFPYGLLDATRILQEVERPILLVCAEKFSDKVGSIRTSRMIFGDAAAAMVVGPAAPEQGGDVDVLQTYASGPCSQVNSIIWPNTEFGNDITVYGPEVKALVKRYIEQMLAELGALPGANGAGSALESIELIVPHQANKTMVIDIAARAGIDPEHLYFNIARVGNTSAASIPLAIHDAVVDGVLTRRTRVFTPGFGAGAVAGYGLLSIDPAIVARERVDGDAVSAPSSVEARPTSARDVEVAFVG